MVLVYSSQYNNVMALIFVSHLYDLDYIPLNQQSPTFKQNYKIRWEMEINRNKKMLKEENIFKIILTDTETTIIYNQQLSAT